MYIISHYMTAATYLFIPKLFPNELDVKNNRYTIESCINYDLEIAENFVDAVLKITLNS